MSSATDGFVGLVFNLQISDLKLIGNTEGTIAAVGSSLRAEFSRDGLFGATDLRAQ